MVRCLTMVRILGSTLSVLGAILAAILLSAHAKYVTEAETADGATAATLAICGESAGCDRVLESRWAWFPPLPKQSGPVSDPRPGVDRVAKLDTPSHGLRIPVALLGLFYFSLLAMFFLKGEVLAAKAPRLVLAFCALGALASVVLSIVMIRVVGAFCPLCGVSHLLNFVILALVCRLLYSRRDGQRLEAAEFVVAGASRVYPAGFGGKAFAGLVVVVWTVELLSWQGLMRYENDRTPGESLSSIPFDAESIDTAFLEQEKMAVTVRDDSEVGLDSIECEALLPALDGLRNIVVIFGDAECGACRRFHEFLMEQVVPAYEGHLRVVFKHRPLDAIHPEARRAALALEAARRQGKFWEMLDLFYGQQTQIAGFDYQGAIRQLDMDVTRFVRDMTSPDASARVAQDEALAQRLAVEGTPAVFLNERRVDKSLLRQPAFWNSQIERLRVTRTEAGQGWGGGDGAPEKAVALRP